MDPGAEEQAGKVRKFPRTWDENCPGLKAQNSFFDTPFASETFASVSTSFNFPSKAEHFIRKRFVSGPRDEAWIRDGDERLSSGIGGVVSALFMMRRSMLMAE